MKPDAQPTVLLLAAGRPRLSRLERAARRLAGSPSRPRVVVAAQRRPERDEAAAALDGAFEVHALVPAAAEHGPAFRRTLAAAAPADRLAVLATHDATLLATAPQLVVGLDDKAAVGARALAAQVGGAVVVGVDAGVQALVSMPSGARARRRPRVEVPRAVRRTLATAPGIPDVRRAAAAGRGARDLLETGQLDKAQQLARDAAARLDDPRLRADLLGEVTSWLLAHGHQPELVVETVAAELAVADAHLAAGRPAEAAQSFDEAARSAFHRVLHFDHTTSPLALDPAGFTAPLRDSRTAAALRGGSARDAQRRTGQALTTDPAAAAAATAGAPVRLAILTRKNADFLHEIRDHFEHHDGYATSFTDVLDAGALERYFGNPDAIARAILTDDPTLTRAAEHALRAHLDEADVVFCEWATALAALLTRIPHGRARLVVRVHSYEAFTVWPQLIDWSRVDDVVFVSDHLRDLAVAAVPGLQGAAAPRLHVVANSMRLHRFARPKPDGARFTLGVVGASKLVKDPRWAIEVLRELRRRDERYRLVLLRGTLEDPTAASHAYVEAFERDLAELVPSGAVQVLGHTDDVPAALEQVGVVVSSSVRESFHLGLVEGAASGAVPVVRDWPYFPGAVRTLFPADWVVDSPRAAAERVLAVTADEETWRKAGAVASGHVIGRWDWDDVVSHDLERVLRPC